MPSNAPLLTFAIPTYNRAHILERLLSVLAEELQGEARVELLISDNASPDKTSAIIAAQRDQGLPIRYIRNETNIGTDRNILQCFEQAAGKYVWIFSDDDLPAPGAIRRILETLSSQEYDLVGIRSYSFVGDYHQHMRFTPKCDLVFARADHLARFIHVFFTFISGIIVNKDRVSSVDHPPFDSLFDTNLAQLGPYYAALNHHRKSLFIRDPLVAATGNATAVGYSMYGVFGRNLTKITDEWIQQKAVRQAIYNGAIRSFFPSWILSGRKSHDPQSVEDPHNALQPCFGYNFRYWAFDYPIYALPLALAEVWMFGVRAINKLDSIVWQSLLRG
jgi:glycosyltransferase involved in cell wall biosynthesis